jgi:hypothetical protein
MLVLRETLDDDAHPAKLRNELKRANDTELKEMGML